VKAEQDRELAKLDRQAHIMDGVDRHHAPHVPSFISTQSKSS
jgi:hypothetical protein